MKKFVMQSKLIAYSIIFFLVFRASAYAQIVGGDANGDGRVNGVDYVIWVNNYNSTASPGISGGDFNNDGMVDRNDYIIWLSNFGKTITASSTPIPTTQPSTTPIPSPSGTQSQSNEWTQHAHDAQRTGYTNQVAEAPWRWRWSWNGPTTTGTVSSGKTTLPRNVQPVTGGGRVYIATGSRGVFALSQTDSNGDRNADVVWNTNSIGTINSTVAYDADTQSVFALSTSGIIYKLNASTGSILDQYATGQSSTLPLPPAVITNHVIISIGSNVYAINKQTMDPLWTYATGSTVHTPPSYSPSRNSIIVGTADLYVHAVNNTNGTRLWRTKPSPNTATSPNEFARGWPVIAEQHGYVLMKMRLDWNAMWTWNPWPTTNAAMRSNLQSQPNQQALFVMDLDDGTIPFIANIGHGGYGDNDYMPMGPQPVVKKSSDGSEVVYTIIRGSSLYDGRWDSHFGEMLLDNTTISGYQAGYVRFINYISSATYLLTDEQPNVTVMGDYVLGGHWMAGLSLKLGDRSSARGSYDNRISSTTMPHIVTSSSSCSFSVGHYCSGSITQNSDPRTFPSGFYIYYNQGTTYDGYWSEYSTWTASNGLVFYRSTDGAIIALESGNP